MNESLKKPLLILALIGIIFIISYLFTKNIGISALIAVLGTVILK